MIKVLSIGFSVLAVLHGLVHLMGFLAYFPLKKISELPYKTSILNYTWEIGTGGMRVYSIFWLLATIAFVVAGIAMLTKTNWGAPLMVAAAILSTVLCILDWKVAYRGVIIDIVILVVLLLVLGLRHQPDPFTSFQGQPGVVHTQPIPEGLPAPVDRFYRQLYGEEIPVYTSAVMSGRGTIRFMGIVFPGRVRFTHISGQSYRHYMEAMVWDYPLFRVNESYLDGHSRLELPFGTFVDAPFTQGAANQGLWAEMAAYPAYYLTDPRTHWEAVDETTAKLYFPYGDEEQEFTLTFDPVTGNLVRLETLRHQDEKSGPIRWWGDMKERNGNMVYEVNWANEQGPWLVSEIEEIVFNADLKDYIRQRGK
jgi:hypothetical protein